MTYIARNRMKTTTALLADLLKLWTQYQSWQRHDLLLTYSQDRLSKVSHNTARELEELFGNIDELSLAGAQLQTAIMERLNELNLPKRQFAFTAEQQALITHIQTRMNREMEIRSLGANERDQGRER